MSEVSGECESRFHAPSHFGNIQKHAHSNPSALRSAITQESGQSTQQHLGQREYGTKRKKGAVSNTSSQYSENYRGLTRWKGNDEESFRCAMGRNFPTQRASENTIESTPTPSHRNDSQPTEDLFIQNEQSARGATSSKRKCNRRRLSSRSFGNVENFKPFSAAQGRRGSIGAQIAPVEQAGGFFSFVKSMYQTLRDHIQRYRIVDDLIKQRNAYLDRKRSRPASGLTESRSNNGRLQEQTRRHTHVQHSQSASLNGSVRFYADKDHLESTATHEETESTLSRLFFTSRIANFVSDKKAIIPTDLSLLPHVIRQSIYECIYWTFHPCAPFINSSSKLLRTSQLEEESANPVLKSIRRIVDRYRKSKSKSSLFSWKLVYSMLQMPPVFAMPEVHYEHMLMYGPIQSPLLLSVLFLHLTGLVYQIYYYCDNPKRLLVVSLLKGLVVLLTLVTWLLEMASYMKVRDLAFSPSKAIRDMGSSGKNRQFRSNSLRGSSTTSGTRYFDRDTNDSNQHSNSFIHTDPILKPSSHYSRDLFDQDDSSDRLCIRKRTLSDPVTNVGHIRMMSTEFPIVPATRGRKRASTHANDTRSFQSVSSYDTTDLTNDLNGPDSLTSTNSSSETDQGEIFLGRPIVDSAPFTGESKPPFAVGKNRGPNATTHLYNIQQEALGSMGILSRLTLYSEQSGVKYIQTGARSFLLCFLSSVSIFYFFSMGVSLCFDGLRSPLSPHGTPGLCQFTGVQKDGKYGVFINPFFHAFLIIVAVIFQNLIGAGGVIRVEAIIVGSFFNLVITLLFDVFIYILQRGMSPLALQILNIPIPGDNLPEGPNMHSAYPLLCFFILSKVLYIGYSAHGSFARMAQTHMIVKRYEGYEGGAFMWMVRNRQNLRDLHAREQLRANKILNKVLFHNSATLESSVHALVKACKTMNSRIKIAREMQDVWITQIVGLTDQVIRDIMEVERKIQPKDANVHPQLSQIVSELERKVLYMQKHIRRAHGFFDKNITIEEGIGGRDGYGIVVFSDDIEDGTTSPLITNKNKGTLRRGWIDVRKSIENVVSYLGAQHNATIVRAFHDAFAEGTQHLEYPDRNDGIESLISSTSSYSSSPRGSDSGFPPDMKESFDDVSSTGLPQGKLATHKAIKSISKKKHFHERPHPILDVVNQHLKDYEAEHIFPLSSDSTKSVPSAPRKTPSATSLGLDPRPPVVTPALNLDDKKIIRGAAIPSNKINVFNNRQSSSAESATKFSATQSSLVDSATAKSSLELEPFGKSISPFVTTTANGETSDVARFETRAGDGSAPQKERRLVKVGGIRSTSHDSYATALTSDTSRSLDDEKRQSSSSSSESLWSPLPRSITKVYVGGQNANISTVEEDDEEDEETAEYAEITQHPETRTKRRSMRSTQETVGIDSAEDAIGEEAFQQLEFGEKETFQAMKDEISESSVPGGGEHVSNLSADLHIDPEMSKITKPLCFVPMSPREEKLMMPAIGDYLLRNSSSYFLVQYIAFEKRLIECEMSDIVRDKREIVIRNAEYCGWAPSCRPDVTFPFSIAFETIYLVFESRSGVIRKRRSLVGYNLPSGAPKKLTPPPPQSHVTTPSKSLYSSPTSSSASDTNNLSARLSTGLGQDILALIADTVHPAGRRHGRMTTPISGIKPLHYLRSQGPQTDASAILQRTSSGCLPANISSEKGPHRGPFPFVNPLVNASHSVFGEGGILDAKSSRSRGQRGLNSRVAGYKGSQLEVLVRGASNAHGSTRRVSADSNEVHFESDVLYFPLGVLPFAERQTIPDEKCNLATCIYAEDKLTARDSTAETKGIASSRRKKSRERKRHDFPPLASDARLPVGLLMSGEQKRSFHYGLHVLIGGWYAMQSSSV